MPTRILTISTATGTFGPVTYGGSFRFAAYAGASTGDKDYAGTVQGSIGQAGQWQTVLTLTTANSTGPINSTGINSTGVDFIVFDKLRMVLTKNNSTHSTPVWLSASV